MLITNKQHCVYLAASPRFHGQTISSNSAFHQISLAKATVNIQPMVHTMPTMLPVLTSHFWFYLWFFLRLPWHPFVSLK
jgi:hypothetical protein